MIYANPYFYVVEIDTYTNGDAPYYGLYQYETKREAEAAYHATIGRQIVANNIATVGVYLLNANKKVFDSFSWNLDTPDA